METYHKIQTLFKRDLDGTLTGKKGKMLFGEWATPELEYLARNQWEFTEKVDGTNIRIGMWAGNEEPEFAGRTDRALIPKPLLAYLTDTFTVEAFENADLHINPIILFGEGYGPKIQNGAKYTGGENLHSFVLFDVKIGDWWLNRKDVDDIASKLGIDSVPTIGTGTLYDAVEIVKSGITFTETGAVKSWGRGGLKSQWGDFEAEGIVARPVTPLFDRKGQRIIAKIKAVDFK